MKQLARAAAIVLTAAPVFATPAVHPDVRSAALDGELSQVLFASYFDAGYQVESLELRPVVYVTAPELPFTWGTVELHLSRPDELVRPAYDHAFVTLDVLAVEGGFTVDRHSVREQDTQPRLAPTPEQAFDVHAVLGTLTEGLELRGYQMAQSDLTPFVTEADPSFPLWGNIQVTLVRPEADGLSTFTIIEGKVRSTEGGYLIDTFELDQWVGIQN